LRVEDSVYLRPGDLPPAEQTVRNLEILLKIAAATASIRGMEPLQSKLLELILDAIPAERGAVLLTGSSTGEFVSVHRYRGDAENQPAQVSRTIVEKVMRDKVGLLSNDVLQDAAIDASA